MCFFDRITDSTISFMFRIVSLVTSLLSFVLDCFFGDLCAFLCVDNRMTHALSFVLDCYVSDLRAFLCVGCSFS